MDRRPTIRFFWDFSVRVPLWMDDGLVGQEPAWLRNHLGLSDELIADLSDWGSVMCDADENEDNDLPPDMEARADRLVSRLRSEIGDRYLIVRLED